MSLPTTTTGVQLTPSESASRLIVNGWFQETEALWPGQRFSLQVESVLLNGKSAFQDILVFESTSYGRVLVLDGVIQVTERDEFSYQEMITHLPMFANKIAPKKVLIIGGGDGGVLREVVKHSCVEIIHMCEIDQQVCEVGKAYFKKTMSTAFDDSRVTLMYDDAARYLQNEGKTQNYDVIICDSSDPVGPAETLFKSEFFTSMYDALSPTGIMCTQGECMWLHMELIAKVVQSCKNVGFPIVRYAYTTIPSYPSGQIGHIIACKDSLAAPMTPGRLLNKQDSKLFGLKYYSSAIHKASFVLPEFAASALDQYSDEN